MRRAIICTIQSNKNRCRFPIPRFVRDALGWRAGDSLAITVNPDNTVTLTKLNPPPAIAAAAEIHP